MQSTGSRTAPGTRTGPEQLYKNPDTEALARAAASRKGLSE